MLTLILDNACQKYASKSVNASKFLRGNNKESVITRYNHIHALYIMLPLILHRRTVWPTPRKNSRCSSWPSRRLRQRVRSLACSWTVAVRIYTLLAGTCPRPYCISAVATMAESHFAWLGRQTKLPGVPNPTVTMASKHSYVRPLELLATHVSLENNNY